MAKISRTTSKQDSAFKGSVTETSELTPFQILAPDGKPVREDLIPDLELV
jgi:hypothetical protein